MAATVCLWKTPDSKGCLLRERMEDRRVRSTGFRVAGQTHVYPLSVRRPGVVRSQVFCRKAKLKFSSPGRTAQRPFLGMWLVLMEPIWVHQSRRAAFHRHRTAASGTNEFQIQQNSQLQHEHELIGRRERPLRGAQGTASYSMSTN